MFQRQYLKKRYISEEAVKKALKIDSFRNLSKDKMMQFASMIPYMDKDVALAIIAQFPEYVGFAKVAIETYKICCQNILEQNSQTSAAVINGYQTILDGLSKRLQIADISEQERKSITEDMMACAKEIAIQDEKNKKFLLKMTRNHRLFLFGIVAMVGAAIGISSWFGGNDGIPHLDDEENTDDNEDNSDDE